MTKKCKIRELCGLCGFAHLGHKVTASDFFSVEAYCQTKALFSTVCWVNIDPTKNHTSVGPAYIMGDGKMAKTVDFGSKTPSSRIA